MDEKMQQALNDLERYKIEFQEIDQMNESKNLARFVQQAAEQSGPNGSFEDFLKEVEKLSKEMPEAEIVNLSSSMAIIEGRYGERICGAWVGYTLKRLGLLRQDDNEFVIG